MAGILSFLSGGIIFSIGVWVIYKAKKKEDLHKHCCGGHHSKEEKKLDKSNLLTSFLIGFATGIIPCPTVIVAYLSGVSTGNTALGLQSVAFFGFGMFIALLSLIIFFNIGGQKIIQKLTTKKTSKFNWGYIQGGVFLVIGVFTAFLH